MANETVTYDTKTPGPIPVEGDGQSLWERKGFQKQNAQSGQNKKSGTSRSDLPLLKRAFDLVGAGFGLLLLLPLLVAVSVAIKLTSKGSVIFRQQRYGQDGKLFVLYKFRTMQTPLCDETGIEQTVENDPRVTRIGSFLRRSNFDELPQLINVLKGDMSLVGPRPHVPGMLAVGIPYEEFDIRYMDRHKVKPGITGLAQAEGFRGETKDAYAAQMRLELDLKYIETRSFLMDVKIIMKTIACEFFRGNGY